MALIAERVIVTLPLDFNSTRKENNYFLESILNFFVAIIAFEKALRLVSVK